MTQLRRFHRFLVPVVVLLSALPVLADEKGRERTDHDRARQALEQGRIRPLVEIVGMVQEQVPGNVVEVEVEEKRGAFIYEIKIVKSEGQIVEVKVDAATGRILRIED